MTFKKVDTLSLSIFVSKRKKNYKILIFNHRPCGKWAFPFHIRIFYFQEEQRCQLLKGSKNKDSGQEDTGITGFSVDTSKIRTLK